MAGHVALGAGKSVATVKIAAAPAIVCLDVCRLPSDGTNPAGGVDAEGLELHVRYDGALALQERSDAAQTLIRVEFDATPVLIVPYCGEINLVGGAGCYRWAISVPKPWPHAYQPTWHALTRLVARAASFTVPNGHTMLGSLNAGVTLTSGDGDSWLLDGSPKPVGPGMSASPGLNPIRIFTAAYF